MMILSKMPPDKGNKLSETDVGNVLDVTPAFDLFGELATVRVETDKAVVFVKGIVSVIKGEKVRVEAYDTGMRFLCLEHHESCTLIIN
ncbi:hypothetical protein MNBD_GAMMA25-2262 [hydrothermal vent metagenome]|uniref:Uncharacterized protein n=1 Tax=hydrothermal vent metagenome TaxID=652676 RepID=A0A3B1B3G7_9ZZZZ